MAHTGTGTKNKSYKLGAQYAREDHAAGLPRRLTYTEFYQAKGRGEDVSWENDYRPMTQPRGYYASDMSRGYQDTWKALTGPMEPRDLNSR